MGRTCPIVNIKNFLQDCKSVLWSIGKDVLVVGVVLDGKAANGSDWRGCLDDYVRGAEGGEDYFEEEGSESGLKTIKITLNDKW